MLSKVYGSISCADAMQIDGEGKEEFVYWRILTFWVEGGYWGKLDSYRQLKGNVFCTWVTRASLEYQIVELPFE